MEILALAGSPRAESNTKIYIDKCMGFLEQKGHSTETIELRDYHVDSCKGCYGCFQGGGCQVTGDDFHEIFAKMESAKAIIVGSPVYHSSATPELMSLLNRAGFCSRWKGTFFSGKIGAPITVARRAGHNLAFAELLMWFYVNDFVIPGSIYWNVGVAGGKGDSDAHKDWEGMKIIKHFSENVHWLLQNLTDKE